VFNWQPQPATQLFPVSSLPPSFLPSTLTALGWLYVALASLWPRLFDRELIKHAIPDPSGYRMGWLIVWQLPLRVGLPLAILSALPILAAIFLRGWIVVAVSAVMLLVIVGCWLFASPGMRFGIVERAMSGGGPVFEMKRAGQFPRAVILLVVAGLLPAVGMGAVLSWALE